MKVSFFFFNTNDRILTVLHELLIRPLWSESFYRDISTPLRHGHDIPEGRPRTVKSSQLLRFLLTCFHVKSHISLWLPVFVFCIIVHCCTEGHIRLCSEYEKNKQLLFCFYEAVQLKYMRALCVHVTLHLITISVGELEHLPCMQPSYILNSRSQPLSIWMSLSCILLIWSHSNLILSHGLFPVATHKPKLSTAGLK